MELKKALEGIKGLTDIEKDSLLERSIELQESGVEKKESEAQAIREMWEESEGDLATLRKKLKLKM
jgi:hypothetical protein